MSFYYYYGISSGGGTTPPPFDYDSNTYWWDFNSASNTVDDLGTDTVSFVVEKIRGESNAFQPTKVYQPVLLTDGVCYNTSSNRHLKLENKTDITKNTNGWYFGFNFYIPADLSSDSNITSEVLTIQASSGSTASRGRVFVSSSKKVDVRINTAGADGAVSALLQSSTLELSTWYTAEVYIALNSGTSFLKINGTSVDTDTVAFATFPNSTPTDILFGNSAVSGVLSCQCTIAESIFNNAQASTELLSSWSTYLNTYRIQIPATSTVTATTGNGLINVALNSYSNGNSPITDHEFSYRIVGAGSWTVFDDGTTATAPTQITGVTNDNEYEIRHRSQNSVGWSSYSSTVTATPTATPGVPAVIDDLSVVAGSSSLLVLWTKPNANGFTITGHKVYYRIAGSGSAFTLFSSPATGSGTLSETITGLTNGTSYEVDVRSVNSQGESASASPTVNQTPALAPNIQTTVASAVMDIDLTALACYGGSGITLNNLVVAPADGSAQSAYNLQFGNGSTSSTYPTFSGTAGSQSAKLTFDGGDHLTLVGSNTSFLNNIHKTTGGSAFTVVLFFETLIDKGASSQIMFATRNASADKGVTGYLNGSEAMRLDQRGDDGTTSSPAPSITATLGSSTYLGYGCSANGALDSSYRSVFWSESTTGVTNTTVYRTTTSDSAQKLHFMAQATSTGNVASGTILKSIAMFNTRLSNSEMASVVAEYNTRHGVTY
jgi:hypothetical protein